MYLTPLRPADVELIATWFEQKQNFKLPNISKMKSFLKSLFFDKSVVKSAQSQHVSKNKLKNYLEQGRISMREYLYLSR